MKLTVHAEVGQAFVPFLRRQLSSAYRIASLERSGKMPKPRLAALSVVLVGDRRMSNLHQAFMNNSGTTDVLTFPMDFDSKGRVASGEVYVCVPEARRQAGKSGVGVKLELLLYAIHGMLHLLGYDDRTRRAYRAMHEMEDAILTKLGLGPVFAPQSRGQHKVVARGRAGAGKGGGA